MEDLDTKLGKILNEECGLAFPAEYYDAVDVEDFRIVYKAGIEEGWARAEARYAIDTG